MVYFNKDYIKFFSELEINNNKDWFAENKERFKSNVEEPFHKFIDTVLILLKKEDKKHISTAKDCVFRIYRDIRFSKDKTPYKIRMSALLSYGGRKDFKNPGIYLEIGADKVKVYSGIYEPDKDQLEKIRTKISKKLDEFQKIKSNKAFVKRFKEVLGDKSKRLDQKLMLASQKEALILNKQFYFTTEIKSNNILKSGLENWIIECYKDAKEMNDFLKV